MFDAEPKGDLDLEEMEGHIWRLIMEKTILLSIISVVLLAIMTITKVALVSSVHVPDTQSVDPSLQEDRLFVACKDGSLEPAGAAPLPARLDGKRIALLLPKDQAQCVTEAFRRGASGLVFGQVSEAGP